MKCERSEVILEKMHSGSIIRTCCKAKDKDSPFKTKANDLTFKAKDLGFKTKTKDTKIVLKNKAKSKD